MFAAVRSFSDDDERGTVIKSIRTIGIAAVVDGDVSSAFERAKKSALREAVEAGVGVLVSNKTRVLNHTIIEDDVITRSLGYVREYKVIDRRQIDKNTYVKTDDKIFIEGVAEVFHLGKKEHWDSDDYMLMELGARNAIGIKLFDLFPDPKIFFSSIPAPNEMP